MERKEGYVKWFNEEKGFGFIERKNEDDIFVHYKDIDSEGRRTLLEGQFVSFIIVQTDKGIQAGEVIVLS